METVPDESRKEGAQNAQAKSSSRENAPAQISAVVAPTPTKVLTPTKTPIPPPTPSVEATPTVAPTPTEPPTTSVDTTPTITPTSTVDPTPTVDTEPPTAPTPTTLPTPTSFAVPPIPTDPPKKSKRDDRNKKEDEYVKSFLKAINSASSVEEKIQIATQKYTHMVEDNKKMQFYIKQSEKRYAMLMKEKDQLQLEFNKAILGKSRMENLCREFQKQNKSIKEESLLKIREEEERRKETQAKFQSTLTEITALLQQNNEKNAKLRDDNISMTEKFKNVVQQYQLRDQQIEKMAKQMALEQQLADAKFMKASLEHQAERERLLAEMEGLKMAVQQHRARVMELQGTESGLRSQLAVYTDKYDEFQNALVKSNQVFGRFKDEMEKMSKKIKKLEKESLSWKQRWESSQTALLDMCGERQAGEERAAAVARQLHNMQSLCRTLQAERTVLLNTLKEHNIERPPLPAPAPAPPPQPQPASNAKVDAMAANCVQLRQSLAHLQSQLNVLTNKQQQPTTTPDEPNQTKPEKSKKSKSKKSKKQEAPKESESDSNAKESATESANEERPKALETAQTLNEETKAVTDKVEIPDTAGKENEAKASVTDSTIETLIQAINNANVNLCDLEVVSDDKIDIDDVIDVIEADSLSKDDEVTKSTDTASAEASEIETSNKDSSNEDSPKNGPKAESENVNGVAEPETLKKEEIAKKEEEIDDEITNGPNLVEITDEIASRPKIIELPDDYVVPANIAFVASNVGIPKEVKHAANTEIKAKASDSKTTKTDA